MKWASGISERADTEAAFEEAVAGVQRRLGRATPDLVLLFVTPHHVSEDERLMERVREAWGTALLVGCSARSVIGEGREIEAQPGLSLTAARLPGVDVGPIRLGEEAASDADPTAWDDASPVDSQHPAHLVLLADPFTCDAEGLVETLDAQLPGSVKIGGLASGGVRAGENALFLGDEVYRGGLVGVALRGDLVVEAIVAQGCRPIGQPLFVTRSRGNVLLELDGSRATEVLQGLYERLPSADRTLLRTSLFLGVEMRAEQSEYRAGDFLVRNLVGIDAERGGLVVGAQLRVGQVVQFHLRDARASAQDLDQRLARYVTQQAGTAPPEGALLFSCLGRGLHLYGRPDHDASAFRAHVGDVPLGGFFCNGEIGPVQGRTFLHGYTSAFGLFRPPG